MEIMVKRRFLGDKYTIGSLFVNGERFRVDGKAVDTLEDKNRDANMNGRFDDGERKMYGQTCIPFGKYEVGLDFSPKFSKKPSYTAFVRKGKMPHIRNVPSFEGILIHGGNTPADTLGCLLVGFNTIKGGLTQSLHVFKQLYAEIVAAMDNGEKVSIEFVP